jgi:hypothetical protein
VDLILLVDSSEITVGRPTSIGSSRIIGRCEDAAGALDVHDRSPCSPEAGDTEEEQVVTVVVVPTVPVRVVVMMVVVGRAVKLVTVKQHESS